MTRFETLGPGREFELIRAFVAEVGHGRGVEIGPGDDCAVLDGGIVVSCDASVEGTHFKRDWLSAEEIGYRAAIIALSDLAAMAAEPVAIFTALVMPAADYGDYALQLMHGINRAAQRCGAVLAGGDTAGTDGPLVIDVTVIGKAKNPVLRSGARAGDHIFVTGQLGAAAAAVAAWQNGKQPSESQRARYAAPVARIREARWLADHVDLHAMIDLSDGLAGDLGHIAAASEVGLVIDAAAVPVFAGASSALALAGGDDYELCFAAGPASVEQSRSAFVAQFGIPLTRIGEVVQGKGVQISSATGSLEPPALGGYDHFAGTK